MTRSMSNPRRARSESGSPGPSRVVMLGLVLAIVSAGAVAGCGSSAQPSPSGATGSTGTSGKSLVETKCSLCHTLDRVWAAGYDQATWEQTVTRMQGNGLVVTDAEKSAIVAYLAGL